MLNAIRSHTRRCLSINRNAAVVSTSPTHQRRDIHTPTNATGALTHTKSSLGDCCRIHQSTMASPQILQGKVDRFNGILIDSTENASVEVGFQEALQGSLIQWEQEQKRAIWFKVHLAQSKWIPILVENGFKFHHAKEEYVMMLRWLPTEECCNVPPFAHTLAGVGAVVVNDSNEVLVVSDKYVGRVHWKLPGGYVEPGENFVDAAIREVYEETNIHTEFRSVLALRHAHGGQFSCSDLYTVVSLKPLSNNVKKCDREIQDVCWMKIDEYMSHPHIHELNRLFVRKYLENEKHNLRIECTHGLHQVYKMPYVVYHAIPKSESDANSLEKAQQKSSATSS